MSRLNTIIELAKTKDMKNIKCSKCKGTGFTKHVQDGGKCYKCMGRGVVPNKWKSIHDKAINLQDTIAKHAAQINEAKLVIAGMPENPTWEQQDMIRKAEFDLRFIESYRENYKKQIISLERKAGLYK